MTKQQNHGLDKGEWAILGVVALLVGLTIWHVVDERRVVTVEPLGKLGTLSTLGAMGSPDSPGRSVWISGQGIETPTAYYPLRGSVALDKGVALVLSTNKGGGRFICDVQHKACVPTSRVDKHITRGGTER